MNEYNHIKVQELCRAIKSNINDKQILEVFTF